MSAIFKPVNIESEDQIGVLVDLPESGGVFIYIVQPGESRTALFYRHAGSDTDVLNDYARTILAMVGKAGYDIVSEEKAKDYRLVLHNPHGRGSFDFLTGERAWMWDLYLRVIRDILLWRADRDDNHVYDLKLAIEYTGMAKLAYGDGFEIEIETHRIILERTWIETSDDRYFSTDGDAEKLADLTAEILHEHEMRVIGWGVETDPQP